MSEFEFDVFVSYSHQDRAWVELALRPRLISANLSYVIDRDSFEAGVTIDTNMTDAINKSRCILFILTPEWEQSSWSQYEFQISLNLDPSGRKRRLLPLLLRSCNIPQQLTRINMIDLTGPNTD